ncbi:MAG: sensor domain-containing diguanylate cyclase [Burkholderiaceae bacterium]|nr:sensor domain-containing diguanylate cyclase [Burkholderiaceae bacterium]
MVYDPMARLLDYWLTRWGIPALLLIVLVVISEYSIHLESIRIDQQEHSAVLGKMATIRARLDGELNSTVSLATGLVGLITVDKAASDQRSMRVLSTLYSLGKHVRVIAIAPNNVINKVYPLKGNEVVLGRHYGSIPGQWPSVEKAILTHQSVLSGPTSLLQGGVGLINRTPVFNDDGSYWGVLSFVIDFDGLFTGAGMSALADDVRYAVRGKDGMGAQGEVFFGDAALFAKAPLLMQIAVPGGSWELAALPVNGWGGQKNFFWLHALGLLIALITTAFNWLFLHERWKTRISMMQDGLTGLPNRRVAMYRLEVEIGRCERLKKHFAVLFVDLDGFKPINDVYGHKAGDTVLQVLGQRMSTAVRKTDLVARLGGDEFLVILTDIEPEKAPFEVAAKLEAELRQPITLADGSVVALGGSVGISIYPEHGVTADALMASADEAMYQVKRETQQHLIRAGAAPRLRVYSGSSGNH